VEQAAAEPLTPTSFNLLIEIISERLACAAGFPSVIVMSRAPHLPAKSISHRLSQGNWNLSPSPLLVSKQLCAVEIVRKFTLGQSFARILAQLEKLKRSKFVVQVKPGQYKLCDIYALASQICVSKTLKISSAQKLTEKPVFVRPDTLMEDVDLSRVNICTSDGTSSGKLLGVVIVK